MAVKGLLGRGVPTTLPKWLLYVKIVILVLALVVLALSAFAISVFSSGSTYYGYYYAGTGAPGLLIFVAIKTLIVYGVVTAVQIWAPQMFFRIAALIAYFLGIIFWLASWAWAASVAGAYFSLANLYASARYGDLASKLRQEGGAMAGAAAIGAIAWVLSIVNVIFFMKACLNDPESDPANQTHQQAELGQVPYKAQEAQGPMAPQGFQQPPYQQPQQQPMYGQPAPAPAPAPVYGQPAPVYGQPGPYQQQPYPTQ